MDHFTFRLATFPGPSKNSSGWLWALVESCPALGQMAAEAALAVAKLAAAISKQPSLREIRRRSIRGVGGPVIVVVLVVASESFVMLIPSFVPRTVLLSRADQTAGRRQRTRIA
jgi:hypothetical protein